MSDVNRSVLVGHTPEQMFALVDAVEEYPRFLPWCGGARVLHRDERKTRAEILINYHGIRHSFTTENEKTAPREMLIRLVEGPFRRLDGTWRFNALGDHACKIELRLHYEFSSRLLEKLVGPVFNHIANTLVEAFVRRAEQVYGRETR
ncbi:MAG TPA: type II toxin-antitoxin system RatA family toxin [Burkholderiales bacterium]|nr:type II toxin-antitoxin system RatA family toxin [Burkholderiales bacterium]